jgi:hypothetical protein
MLANRPLITVYLHCFVTGWLQQTSFEVPATLSDMVYSMFLPKMLQNCHRSCKHTENQGDGGGAKGGFQKPVPISEALASFLGIAADGGGGGLAAPIMMSRPEITRRFWEYFKAHQLQDPADKRCSVHYCSWSSASQCGLKGQDARELPYMAATAYFVYGFALSLQQQGEHTCISVHGSLACFLHCATSWRARGSQAAGGSIVCKALRHVEKGRQGSLCHGIVWFVAASVPEMSPVTKSCSTNVHSMIGHKT